MFIFDSVLQNPSENAKQNTLVQTAAARFPSPSLLTFKPEQQDMGSDVIELAS